MGVAALAESLPANHKLERLYLGYNNINEAGAVFLLHKVARNRTLLMLEVSGNPFGSTRSYAALKLMMVHSSLKSLVLAFTGITDEGAIALAEALAENQRLFELDVTGNTLMCPGLLAFSLTMRINKSLGRLRFDTPIERKDRMDYALSLARQIEASCLYNSEHSLPMGPVASRAESSRVEYPPAAILEANPIKGFLMESFSTLNDIDDEIFVDPVEVEEKLVVFADSSVGVPVHLPIESVTTDLPNVIPLAVSVQNIQEILENVSISASTEVIHEIIEGACNTNETAVALATTDETVASPAMLHNVDDDENMPSSNAVLKV